MSKNKYQQLAANIREIVANDPSSKNGALTTVSGVVKSIQDDTCTVEIREDFEVSDVKLKSTANNEDNFLIIPKVGTRVTLVSIDGTIDNLSIIKVDAAEKVIFKENGLEVIVDSSDKKVTIKNDESSLFELLQDLVNLLKQLKVSTAMGPSGTPLPDSLTSIENFEIGIKRLLK